MILKHLRAHRNTLVVGGSVLMMWINELAKYKQACSLLFMGKCSRGGFWDENAPSNFVLFLSLFKNVIRSKFLWAKGYCVKAIEKYVESVQGCCAQPLNLASCWWFMSRSISSAVHRSGKVCVSAQRCGFPSSISCIQRFSFPTLPD